MFERVLVAYDGSEAADAGLRFAAELSSRCASQVTVLHVLSPGDSVHGAKDASTEASLRSPERADEWLADVCRSQSVSGSPAMVPALAEHDRVATAIIERAEDIGADLAIAGRSGRHGLRRFLLGSVAERLIEYAPCSIAVFAGPVVPATPARVMAAYDGSESSREALNLAASLASVQSAGLLIVHVVDYRIPFAGTPPISARDALRKHAEQVLHEATIALVQPLEAAQTELREGDPRAGLLEAADEHRPTMLVLGHRGIAGFVGLRLGSTAREVAYAARVPVLVARPRP